MKGKLARLEERLQALVEGSAALLFPSREKPPDLAALLVEAMRDGVRSDDGRAPEAPNLYTIHLHPTEAAVLTENPALVQSLTETLQESAIEEGWVFPTSPAIRVQKDPQIPHGEARVTALNSQEGLGETSDLPVDDSPADVKLPENAFLIVNGTHTYPLDASLINIGRRSDNELTIDDARVSRVHAQLRAIRGRFVIFDLDSTGGTFLNGERINRAVLYPGDVVSLAGVPLVYGQDPASQRVSCCGFPPRPPGRACRTARSLRLLPAPVFLLPFFTPRVLR